MFRMVSVDCPYVLEEVAVCLIGQALDKPVNRGIEQALILIIGQVRVSCLHHAVVELKHVLHEQEQVVFVHRVQSVAHSSQVSASVTCTQRLGNASDHLGETDQVRLMDAPLHVLLGGDHGQLQVNAGKHFSDA